MQTSLQTAKAFLEWWRVQLSIRELLSYLEQMLIYNSVLAKKSHESQSHRERLDITLKTESLKRYSSEG